MIRERSGGQEKTRRGEAGTEMASNGEKNIVMVVCTDSPIYAWAYRPLRANFFLALSGCDLGRGLLRKLYFTVAS